MNIGVYIRSAIVINENYIYFCEKYFSSILFYLPFKGLKTNLNLLNLKFLLCCTVTMQGCILVNNGTTGKVCLWTPYPAVRKGRKYIWTNGILTFVGTLSVQHFELSDNFIERASNLIKKTFLIWGRSNLFHGFQFMREIVL